MANKTQTTKIWVVTLQKLRMIYALTGERMVGIMDRLVRAELERVERECGLRVTMIEEEK